jgi:hypothetical protein
MDRIIEKLRPDEKGLIGKWVEGPNNQAIGDHNCERVQALTDGYLERMGVSEESGGWDTLFIDPEDGRYWERIYMESYMHGGGPPSLINLSEGEARRKYPKLF